MRSKAKIRIFRQHFFSFSSFLHNLGRCLQSTLFLTSKQWCMHEWHACCTKHTLEKTWTILDDFYIIWHWNICYFCWSEQIEQTQQHWPSLARQSYKLEACQFGYKACLDLDDNEIASRFAQLGLKCAMICLDLTGTQRDAVMTSCPRLNDPICVC